MTQRTVMSSGQVLGQAEESIGTTLRTAVADYYQGKDLSTANTIRDARSPTEAARIVTAMRQGRALEVLLIASSAVGGAIAGVLSQKAVGNATVKECRPCQSSAPCQRSPASRRRSACRVARS
ncbi:hypothetical protein [Nannocystis pusilla]|uniref:hypothetical protein n=1 Tax=Nannocystis pusilla TaxID=889268 RepID=UPI003B7C88C3